MSALPTLTSVFPTFVPIKKGFVRKSNHSVPYSDTFVNRFVQTRGKIGDVTKTDKFVLGRRIRQARKAKDWSQDDLAMRMSLVRSGISEMETGNRKVDIDDLQALIVALEIHPRELIPEWFEQRGEEAELIEAYWRIPAKSRSNTLASVRNAADAADAAREEIERKSMDKGGG